MTSKDTSPKTIYVTGELKFPWLTKTDRFGKYSTKIKPDDASMKVIMESGLNNKVDADGFVSFTRNAVKKIKGVNTDNPPPMLLNSDNSAFDKGAMIGSGTVATIKLDTYYVPVLGRRAASIEVVRIEKLVQYGGRTAVNEPSVGAPF